MYCNQKSTAYYGHQKFSPESGCTGCANSTTDLSDVIEVDDTPGARCASRMKGHSFPNCLKSPFRRKYLL